MFHSLLAYLAIEMSQPSTLKHRGSKKTHEPEDDDPSTDGSDSAEPEPPSESDLSTAVPEPPRMVTALEVPPSFFLWCLSVSLAFGLVLVMPAMFVWTCVRGQSPAGIIIVMIPLSFMMASIAFLGSTLNWNILHSLLFQRYWLRTLDQGQIDWVYHALRATLLVAAEHYLFYALLGGVYNTPYMLGHLALLVFFQYRQTLYENACSSKTRPHWRYSALFLLSYFAISFPFSWVFWHLPLALRPHETILAFYLLILTHYAIVLMSIVYHSHTMPPLLRQMLDEALDLLTNVLAWHVAMFKTTNKSPGFEKVELYEPTKLPAKNAISLLLAYVACAITIFLSSYILDKSDPIMQMYYQATIH